METCYDCQKITSGDCGRHQRCIHDFVFSGKFIEATNLNLFYHEVGYSVCRNCGEVRKNDLKDTIKK